MHDLDERLCDQSGGEIVTIIIPRLVLSDALPLAPMADIPMPDAVRRMRVPVELGEWIDVVRFLVSVGAFAIALLVTVAIAFVAVFAIGAWMVGAWTLAKVRGRS
jgi:hypothetical protein